MESGFTQLLVHMSASKRSLDRLQLARTVAQEHGAALACLYAATPSYLALPYAPELGPALAASLFEMDEQRRASARRIFDDAMALPGKQASWGATQESIAIRAFARQALYADLLVLGQHDPDDADAGDVPPDFAQAVLAVSGKPAIIVPYAGAPETIGRSVVIAWKATREAARAVAAAMPLIRRASRVHVLEWGRYDDPAVSGAGLDLRRYLLAHQVEAAWHRGGDEPAQLGEVLLSRAFDLDAGLLVMGCYGHGRTREWVLGGVSRTVLRSMTLPVLMAH